MNNPLSQKTVTANLENLDRSSSLINLESVWLQNKERKNTQTTYRIAFVQFVEVFNIRSPEDFRSVTMAEIIHFRHYLAEDLRLKPRTIRNKLSALSNCYEFLKKNGVIKDNPVNLVERPKVNDRRGVTPVMADKQVLSILRQPKRHTLHGARDYAILCFYLYMGTRVSSARSMAVGDYYQDNGHYVLSFEKKGGERQIEPVNPQLQDALNKYLALSGHQAECEKPLFGAVKHGKNAGNPLSRQQFSNIWGKHRQSAGLDKKFTPHSARATMATLLDRLGEPLQNIQHLLGHANPSTTQTYMHKIVEYKDSPVFRANYGTVGESEL